MAGIVTHLHLSPEHGLAKDPREMLRLVAGMGAVGDAHYGATVQHRSRVAVDPSQPNLRQVHLLQGELHDELGHAGFDVAPGDLGENITTRGLDLPALPVGTVLRVGDVLLALTGLRNPCLKLDDVRPGLFRAARDEEHGRHRAGVMAVVLLGGDVAVGDRIDCSLPPGPPVRLRRV